jgi:hypothetical protein
LIILFLWSLRRGVRSALRIKIPSSKVQHMHVMQISTGCTRGVEPPVGNRTRRHGSFLGKTGLEGAAGPVSVASALVVLICLMPEYGGIAKAMEVL